MSNESIKKSIEQSLAEYERGKISAADLATAISLHGSALEGIPKKPDWDRSRIVYEIETSSFQFEGSVK
jgi:hypothetical protein